MVFSQNFRQAIPVDLCPADDGFPHANFGRKVIKKTRGNRMGWVDSMGFNGIWWDLVEWLWDDYGMIMRYVAECIYLFSIQDLHPAPSATYCNYPIAVPRREELPATQESPNAHGIETVRKRLMEPPWTHGLLILDVKLSMKPRAQVSPSFELWVKTQTSWGESKMANLEVFRVLFRHTHQTCPGCSPLSRWDNIEMIYNS